MLDSSPERPRKKTSYVGPLIDHLLALDLESLSSRREADQLLQDKIPVSLLSPPLSHTLSLSHTHTLSPPLSHTHTHTASLLV